jgi:hypothetical protein
MAIKTYLFVPVIPGGKSGEITVSMVASVIEGERDVHRKEIANKRR